MKSFSHYNPKSVEEAVQVLSTYDGKAKPNAGGTDLLGILKEKSLPEYPEAIVNLKTIEGLSYIKEEEDFIAIGSLTKLSEIAGSQMVREKISLLADAAKEVATPQIRNMATVGGNLAQDVRCWYYRYPHHLGGRIVCLRKGGTLCNALSGDNRYHSIFGVAPMEKYPCAEGCPAKTDIPFYMSYIKEGKIDEAGEIMMKYNPIPAITGRVCPIFCEPKCNRKSFDEPLAIRCVERYLGDQLLENKEKFYRKPCKENGRSVAIVGSGPAGLTAAYYLRKKGYSVVVYEKLKNAGGMLYNTIPSYRLPKPVVKRQIEALEEMGIKFKTGVEVGVDIRLEELSDRYNAVFLAAGAWKERKMGIEGEGFAISGLSFLMSKEELAGDIKGKKVAVIGGGNVAVDVARTLLRMGATPSVLYRRTKGEMPAFEEETRKALEEGVEFSFLTLPKAIKKVDGKLELSCVKMRLSGKDESGRPRPVPVKGSEFTMLFDFVIKATGEEPEWEIIPGEIKRDIRKEPSGAYKLEGNLFIGGDFANGPSTVIEASASGRAAFTLIDKWIRGDREDFIDEMVKQRPNTSIFVDIPRVSIPEIPPSERIKVLEGEETPDVGWNEIKKEAERCFNCGCLAVNPSDMAVALIALDGEIVTTKKRVRAEELFTDSGLGKVLLDPDEIIKEIRIPKPKAGSHQRFLKFTLRKPVDFAIASVATSLVIKDGLCVDARIVLGSLAPVPLRAKKAEELLIGKPIDESIASVAASLALSDAKPLGMNAYKVEIGKTLVKRSIFA
ncbi:MAG: FAD binding domain-containing protein [Syntrophorhabdaceae bacterium]|nr:FAD binding domain-containing protein [Syntrophorhabdaceae bacterium]